MLILLDDFSPLPINKDYASKISERWFKNYNDSFLWKLICHAEKVKKAFLLNRMMKENFSHEFFFIT